MANQYADAKEADLRHKDEVTRVPQTDRLVCRNDDRHEDRRNNDCAATSMTANTAPTIMTITTD